MTHDELRDSYELYAMGIADEAEREEIRGHLDRGCEVCMKEVKRARSVTALLAGSVDPVAPSPKLRRRILASVGIEQRRFGWSPFLAAAAALALFAAFYFSGREREFANLSARLDEQLRNQSIELTRLNEAFAIINGADTTVTTFGKGPKGKVFVNPTQGVILIASNLPAPPAGKAYEMWVVPKGGKTPIPAGVFRSDDNGNAMHIQRGPVNVADAAAVAVTLENAAGSATPTLPILITAPVQ